MKALIEYLYLHHETLLYCLSAAIALSSFTYLNEGDKYLESVVTIIKKNDPAEFKKDITQEEFKELVYASEWSPEKKERSTERQMASGSTKQVNKFQLQLSWCMCCR